MADNFFSSVMNGIPRPEDLDEMLEAKGIDRTDLPTYWTIYPCGFIVTEFDEILFEHSYRIGNYYNCEFGHFTLYAGDRLYAGNLKPWEGDPWILYYNSLYFSHTQFTDIKCFVPNCNCDEAMMLEFQSTGKYKKLLGHDGENQLCSLIASRKRRRQSVDHLMILIGRLHLPGVREFLERDEFPPVDVLHESFCLTKRNMNVEFLKEGLVSEKALQKYNEFHRKKKQEKLKKLSLKKKQRDISRKIERDAEFAELNAAYFDFSQKKIASTYMNLETQSFKVVNDMLDNAIGKLGSLKSIGPAIVFATQLYRSTAWEDVVLAIAAFKFGARDLFSRFSSYFDKLFGHLKHIFIQSISGGFISQSWSSFMMRSLDGPIAGVCASIISLCALAGVLPEKAMHLSKFCITTMKQPRSIRQLITYISTLLGRFENFGHLVTSGASVRTLLLGNVEVNSIFKEYNFLKKVCENPSMMYSGFPQANKYTYDEIVRRVKKLLEEVDAYFECNPGNDRISSMESVKLDLQNWFSNLKGIIAGQERQFPFVIVLHGAAGVGKSGILDYLMQSICNLYGIEWRSDLMYDRIRGTEYWDGYDPYSHPFIHYSEVGNEAVGLAIKNGSPILDEINRLADSQRFMCNMAFEKGKVYANPKVIVIDTNNPDMHMSKTMFCTDAIQRRCTYIGVKPLGKYTAADGKQIDFKKSMAQYEAAGDCILDRYRFTVTTYIGEKKTRTFKKLALFTKAYMKLYLAHIERTPKIKDVNTINLSKSIADELIKRPIIDENCEINNSVVSEALGHGAPCEEKKDYDDVLLPHIRPADVIDLERHAQRRLRNDDLRFISKLSTLVNVPVKELGGMIIDKFRKNTKHEAIDFDLDNAYAKILDGSAIDEMFSDLKKFDSDHIINQLREEKNQDAFVYNQPNDSFIDELVHSTEIPLKDNEFDFMDDWGDKMPDETSRLIEDLEVKDGTNLSTQSRDYISISHEEEKGNISEDEKVDRFEQDVEQLPRSQRIQRDVEEEKINLEWLPPNNVGVYVPPRTWWDVYFWFLHRLPNIFTLVCVAISIIFRLKLPFSIRVFFLICLAFLGFTITALNFIPFVIAMVLTYFHDVRFGTFKLRKFLTNPIQHANFVAVRSWVMWFGDGKWLRKYYYGTAFVAAVLMLKTFYSLLKKPFEYTKGETQSVYFTNTIDEMNEIKDFTTRLPSKDGASWNNLTNMYLGTFSGNFDTFRKCVFANIVQIRCVETERSQFGLLTGGGYFIFNKHIAEDLNTFTLEFFKNDKVHGTRKFVIGEGCVEIAYDLCMIQYTRSSKHLLNKGHFAKSVFKKGFKGNFNGHDVKVRYTVASENAKIDEIPFGQKVEMYGIDYNTIGGQCGLPLCLSDGNKALIVGIHFAGSDGKGYSLPITEDILKKGIKMLDSRLMELSSQSFSVEGKLPGRKSLVYYEDISGLTYFGSDGNKVLINNKSAIVRTKFSEEIVEVLSDYLPAKDEVYVPALMKPMVTKSGEYISPWNIGIRKINHGDIMLDSKKVDKCIELVTDRIISEFVKNGVKDLSPIPVENAINGTPVDCYVNRINASTSPGYGYVGKKSDYLPYFDEKDAIRQPNEEIQQDMEEMISTYLNGDMAHPQYKAALKDEVRLLEKALAGKTRLFYMSNLSHLIVSKIFLTKFFTHIVAYGESVCTVVGIDMHRGAERLKNLINPDGTVTDFLEGDWGGFDVKTPAVISHICASIIYRVHEKFGATKQHLEILRGLLSDDVFPIINILGDMFETAGLTPSGKDRTAEFNGLKNLVLFMLAWLDSEYCDLDFFKHLFPITYGDDVVVGNKDCPNFDNLYMAKFAETIGMEYTSASKDGTLTPFVDFDKLSFLKRKLVTLRNGKMLAPINHNTIYKALQWTMPSEFLLSSDQVHSALSSMMYEIFCYMPEDEEKYLEMVNRVKTLYEEKYLVECGSLPTFLDCSNRMWGNRAQDVVTEELPFEVGSFFTQSYALNQGFLSLTSTSNGYDTVNRVDDKPQWYAEEKYEDLDLQDLKLGELYGLAKSLRNPSLPIKMRRRMRKKVSTLIEKLEAENLDMKFSFQSAESDALGEVKMMSTNENLIETIRDEIKVPEGNIFNLIESTHLTNDDIFARPVTIYNSNISDTLQVFNIWSDYFSDPTVRSRLRNFAFFSCSYLEVTITTSGTPSDRGILLLSYQPLALENAALTAIETNFSTYGVRYMLWAYLSQSKQCAYLDVKSNNTVVMKLPFICPKPMVRLYNESSSDLSSATDFSDIDDLGDLYMAPLLNVSSAAGTTNASVHIRARVVGAKLAGLTATRIDIATQSELRRGPVEMVSSAVAAMSGVLVNHPVIGSYAKASQMVFSSISSLSAHLGWSKPVLDELVHTVIPSQGENESLGIGNSAAKRIVLDPLQEVSVDMRVCGDNDDDMVISSIADRWSYLEAFDWSPSNAPMSLIHFQAVTPQQMPYTTDVSVNVYQPTACAFAVMPFSYWRGDVHFRFMAETCAYDRGKLGFFYEPNIYQISNIIANLSTNKNPIAVLDLSTDSSIDICVKWSRDNFWLDVSPPGDLISLESLAIPESCNGVLLVAPITELQSPDLATISVHVLTKCANLRVQGPTSDNLPLERFFNQSGTFTSVTCIEINEETCPGDPASQLMFGEEPISFRTLLKRYNTVFWDTVSTTSAARLATSTMPMYPFPNPNFGDTVDGYPTLFGYLRFAYLGMKGGTRYITQYSNSTQSGFMARAWAHPSLGYLRSSLAESTDFPIYQLEGTITTGISLNPNLEFEVPYSYNGLFLLSFNESPYGVTNTLFKAGGRLSIETSVELFGETEVRYGEHFSTAEDFTFMRFTGAPLFSDSAE